MHNSKKQNPTDAQLTLYYELYQHKLVVKGAAHACELFLQFAKSINNIDGWYVIFLDKKKRFLCWHNVENFCDIPAASKDLSIFAKRTGAKHIIIARLDKGKNTKIGYIDICWIAEITKCCGNKIALADYLIVTENTWFSYTDETIIE